MNKKLFNLVAYVVLFFAGILTVYLFSMAASKKERVTVSNLDFNKKGVATYVMTGTKKETLMLKVKLDRRNPASVTYKSTTPSVAAVNKMGKLTVKKPGETKITITAKKKNGKTVKRTFKLKVKKVSFKVTAPVKSSTYNYNKVTAGNEAFDIEYTINAKTKSVTFKSDNKKVVSVDKTGKAIVKKAGTAKITVSAKLKCSNKVVKKVITVKVADYTFKLADSLGKAKNGIICVKPNQKSFSVECKASKHVKSVSYASSNEAVVSVDGNGKVTVKGEGTAVISVTAEYVGDVKVTENVIVVVDKSGKAPVADKDTDTGKDEVTDSDAVKEIVFFKDMDILNEKGVMEYKKTSKADEQFSISLTAVNFVPVLTVYNSSNTDVATVDNTGMLTFKGAGTTVITVWVTDVSGQIVTGSFTAEVKDESKSDGGFSQEVDPANCDHIFFLIEETDTVDIPEHERSYVTTEDEKISGSGCQYCMIMFLGRTEDALGGWKDTYEEFLDKLPVLLKLAEDNGGYVEDDTVLHRKWTLSMGKYLERRKDGTCPHGGGDTVVTVKTGRIKETVHTTTVPAHKHTIRYVQCCWCGEKEVYDTTCGTAYCQYR